MGLKELLQIQNTVAIILLMTIKNYDIKLKALLVVYWVKVDDMTLS